MKAEELMVGDWVIDTRSNTPLRVNPFLAQLEVPEWEPIPLTPEILEKNGFIKENTWNGIITMSYSPDKEISVNVEFNVEPEEGRGPVRSIDIDSFTTNQSTKISACNDEEVFYVHDLQHALKLCGINLEIKL